jgi:hypothetical protein
VSDTPPKENPEIQSANEEEIPVTILITTPRALEVLKKVLDSTPTCSSFLLLQKK